LNNLLELKAEYPLTIVFWMAIGFYGTPNEIGTLVMLLFVVGTFFSSVFAFKVRERKSLPLSLASLVLALGCGSAIFVIG
jgi:O-antigen ligase